MNPFVAYAKVPMSFLNLKTHFVEAGPYALFLALVFELELAFVHFVQKKVRSDPGFAKQVATTSPRVSMWYAGVSVGVRAASTVVINLAA